MTTLGDLGRMLIEVDENGRVLQELQTPKGVIGGEWYDVYMTERIALNETGSPDYEYRLKPIITFYRVWEKKFSDGSIELHTVAQVDRPFKDWESWQNVSGASLVHDFEVEQ